MGGDGIVGVKPAYRKVASAQGPKSSPGHASPQPCDKLRILRNAAFALKKEVDSWPIRRQLQQADLAAIGSARRVAGGPIISASRQPSAAGPSRAIESWGAASGWRSLSGTD